MKKITISMPAKINLSIDVKNRLENGYHNVEMIMQTIDLFDAVTVEKTDHGISVSCAQPYVPNDKRNIAWKAAELFFSQCPCKGGARITLEKKIPVSAGLGGGSADAAGVLKALNFLYDDCLSDMQLVKISRCLGADVAFFLAGGTQLARGIGDELIKLPSLEGVDVVLVKPDFPVSTRWVYENFNPHLVGMRPDTSKLLSAIEAMDINTLARNMVNVLESVTVRKYPELTDIMGRFSDYGALGSRMSGSGPTIFGLFYDSASAEEAREKFLKDYKHVYHCRTIGRGDLYGQSTQTEA